MLNDKIKLLISMSDSIEEADEVIKEFTKYQNTIEKIAFLDGLFNCKIVHRNGISIEDDYKAILSVIINQKWR